MDIPSRLQEQFGLSDLAVERLYWYVELVRNAPLNLTAWNDEQLWTRGVFESLRLREWFLRQQPGRALDIGSGGGFPGLVLAMTCDEWSWTLLEARQRRGQFLLDAIRELALSNVTVVTGRAEEWIYAEPVVRSGFGAVTMRAVARAPVALELGLPYVVRGGLLFLVQSEAGYAELRSRLALLDALGGDVRYREPELTVIAKVAETPGYYPRSMKHIGR